MFVDTLPSRIIRKICNKNKGNVTCKTVGESIRAVICKQVSFYFIETVAALSKATQAASTLAVDQVSLKALWGENLVISSRNVCSW